LVQGIIRSRVSNAIRLVSDHAKSAAGRIVGGNFLGFDKLGKVNSPESREMLHQMTSDLDPIVSSEARRYLKQAAK
jgi:hypothetical protein